MKLKNKKLLLAASGSVLFMLMSFTTLVPTAFADHGRTPAECSRLETAEARTECLAHAETDGLEDATSASSETACSGGSFFGFPTWYKYLGRIEDVPPEASEPLGDASQQCVPHVDGLSDVWLIVAAVIEMLLRAAAMVAIIFVIVGGVRYLISQGEPDKTAQARSTILSAVIGLAVTVLATALVSFIAGRFTT